MEVVFRVDDIYLDGSLFELNLMQLFFEKKIPLTMGVIPFTKNGMPVIEKLDDQTKFFLNSGYFEVALHGYRHLRNNDWGEFYGVPFDEQLEWINKGKLHLERLTELNVTTFIPPWNAADENTLKAAHAMGFKVISLGHNPKTLYLNYPQISIIPYSVEHLYVLNTAFFKMVRNLLKLSSNSIKTVVVLFHPYNIFEWSDTNPYLTNDKRKFVISFSYLEETLRRLTSDKSLKFSILQELNTLPNIDTIYGLLLNFIHRLLYRRVFKLLYR
jgi:hypothetical protein